MELQYKSCLLGSCLLLCLRFGKTSVQPASAPPSPSLLGIRLTVLCLHYLAFSFGQRAASFSCDNAK